MYFQKKKMDEDQGLAQVLEWQHSGPYLSSEMPSQQCCDFLERTSDEPNRWDGFHRPPQTPANQRQIWCSSDCCMLARRHPWSTGTTSGETEIDPFLLLQVFYRMVREHWSIEITKQGIRTRQKTQKKNHKEKASESVWKNYHWAPRNRCDGHQEFRAGSAETSQAFLWEMTHVEGNVHDNVSIIVKCPNSEGHISLVLKHNASLFIVLDDISHKFLPSSAQHNEIMTSSHRNFPASVITVQVNRTMFFVVFYHVFVRKWQWYLLQRQRND